MEPQFRTSFVPKKPVQTGKPKPPRGPRLGVLFVLTLIVFLVSITLTVGVFLYQQYLESSIARKEQTLEEKRALFEPALIRELSRLDTRLEQAEALLNQHVALTRLFDFLEGNTLQNVQFQSFRYDILSDGNISLAMDGQATSFAAVALQSDVFGDSEVIRSPVFEGLNVGEAGNVVFNVSAFVDTRQVLYQGRSRPTPSADEEEAERSADDTTEQDDAETSEASEESSTQTQ